MTNMTFSVDAQILKKARKVAIDKNTTLSQLVRGYLRELAETQSLESEEIIKQLKKSFNASSVKMGRKKWKREELYDRKILSGY